MGENRDFWPILTFGIIPCKEYFFWVEYRPEVEISKFCRKIDNEKIENWRKLRLKFVNTGYARTIVQCPIVVPHDTWECHSTLDSFHSSSLESFLPCYYALPPVSVYASSRQGEIPCRNQGWLGRLDRPWGHLGPSILIFRGCYAKLYIYNLCE